MPPRSALRFSPQEAALYVEQVRALLKVARPSALFPDGARLDAWLEFVVRPRRAGKRFPVEVALASGLPTRRVLKGLLALQKVAREYLVAFRISPQRPSDAFSVALARAALPALASVEAHLVGRDARGARFVVVHDRLDLQSACLTRFTVQLTQRGAGLLTLSRGEQAQLTAPGARLVEAACAGRPDEVAVQLAAQHGTTVTEVVRADVGPVWSPQLKGSTDATVEGRALAPVLLAAPAPAAVLSMVLERAGVDVRADRCADALGALDTSPPALARRAALGFHAARERRFICTPTLDGPLRAWLGARGGGGLVRSS
jgi:hypothetical protein